jgi:DNA polymerase III sliding clamp (beta) subunit (PCNA family)
MKFKAKLSEFLLNLQPAITCATIGVKKEYNDGFKISLTARKDGLRVDANNGNVALSQVISTSGVEYDVESEGAVTLKATDFANSLASFCADETVQFQLEGAELVMRPLTDLEQLQSVPNDPESVEMPKVSSSYDKEVTVKREILVNALGKVLFAIGVEKFKPEFLYWVMRVRTDGFRLACGCGARFAVYDAEGQNVVKANKSFDICVSKEHYAVLQKMLSSSTEDSVSIKEFVSGGKDSLLDQIVVSIGGTTLVLIGHDPGVKWPDENKFLARKSPFRYTTALSDWAPVVKGVTATYNEEVRKQNQKHYVNMNFDGKKNVVQVKSDHMMKSLRKVAIKDAEGETVDFMCLSSFISDVQKYGAADDRIQIELVDNKQPMVVRFFAGEKISDGPFSKVNGTTGLKEQYVMFIASSKKKS